MGKDYSFIVKKEDSSRRLDVYLRERLPGLSRTFLKELIENRLVLVDGNPAKVAHRVRPGETITIHVPERPEPAVTAQPIDVEILYEDQHIIVVNKPRGLVVHPGAGRTSGTLVNALLYRTELSKEGGTLRPGIVHRLDKDTSGVMVVAKTDTAYRRLVDAFKAHRPVKIYHAIVWGVMEEERGTIDKPLGRDIKDRKKFSPRTTRPRSAITEFRVIRRLGWFTLVELRPVTGRTHQIRVHMKLKGHPVVGDPVYGKRTPPASLPQKIKEALSRIKGQLLHAKTLGIPHPEDERYMEFSADYPEDMKTLLEILKDHEGYNTHRGRKPLRTG